MSFFYNASGKNNEFEINMVNIESSYAQDSSGLSINDTQNSSYGSEFKHPPGVLAIYIIAYSTAFLFALFGNLVVIVVVLKYKWMHTVTNFFIVNLAIADILVAIFCVPITLLTHIFIEWRYGAVMCKVTPYLQAVSVCASVNTLAAIAVDRYLAICYTFNYKMKWKTSKCIMFAIWIFSLIISIPMALFYQRYVQSGSLLYVCGENWENKFLEKIYFVGICICCYAVPLVLIIICYSLIGFRVWNRNAPGVYKSNGVIHKSKVKAVKMLTVVVVLFLFSWLPLYIIKFLIYFQMDEYDNLDFVRLLNNYIVPIAQWLGLSNSGINPIIYCLFSRKIRIRIKMMVKCCRYRFYDDNAAHEINKQTKRFSSTRYFSVDYTNGQVVLRPHKHRKSGSKKQTNIYD
ncbi:neuropeptide FF receptor 2-like [Mytilus edulis]|uniref:NPFFR2 n=1 Tax=Mytilus edulis TaxID=6550 RepID=A0A8S3R7L3_MYTED|nr:NPFFR2 [Mytilus edulis]